MESLQRPSDEALTSTCLMQRSHAHMDEEGPDSPARGYEPFPNNDDDDDDEEASAYRIGLPLYSEYQPAAHYNPRRGADYQLYEHPPARHAAFVQPRRAPAFESALRAARPPIERDSSSSAAPSQQQTSGLRLPRIENMVPSASRRYPGDGFDYRRPAGSSRDQEAGSVDLTREEDEEEEPNDAIELSRIDDIIDLTADDSGYGASQDEHSGRQRHSNTERQDSNHAQANNGGPRLPRGMDIIIDLDNGEEEWRMATPAPEPSSPDIEFISSRPIDTRRLPPPAGNHSDGDEVEFLRENALPEAEIQRRRNRELDNVMDLFGTLNGRFTHLRAQVDRFHSQINRTAGRLQEPIAPTRSASRGHAPRIRLGAFVAPVMDFDTIGFELGPRLREAPAPPPTYEAPPKAPEGFTRSPQEEGALICPNCEEELCVGDDDVKRQVWIVKGCGHVCYMKRLFQHETDFSRFTAANALPIELPSAVQRVRKSRPTLNHSRHV